MSSINGNPARTATPTSGALTKAALRLQRKDEAARRASGVSTAETTRGPQPNGRVRRKLPTVQDQERIAVLRSQGVPVHQIGKALGVHITAVAQALKDPGVIGQIQVIRERLRGINLVSAHAIAEKAWTLAENAIENDDAKSFDAATRGLHAMEKIAASASGENQRMEVTHSGTVVSEPVKIQLQQLIALVRNESP